MSIEEKNRHYEVYGRIRYFLSNRCVNDQFLKEFNQNKISANELITFDCSLMEMREIEYEQAYAERSVGKQVLAVIIRPAIEPNYFLENSEFSFCGYDLVDETAYISAITNCGAEFKKAVSYKALNELGLISSYREAVNTQLLLSEKYPDESHAYCEIVEIWRLI